MMAMMVSRFFSVASRGVLLLLAFLSLVDYTISVGNVCGDCWCIYDGELDECPTAGVGIRDTIPDSLEIYSTFENTNSDNYKLLTSSGEQCFPFADVLNPNELDPNNRYPQARLSQCAIPTSTDTTVCAYLYGEPGTTCSGRKYDIITYDSASAAEEAGAVVVHSGACGVCSNAQDLWTRFTRLETFDDDTLLCASSYAFSSDTQGRFATLQNCLRQLGLTDQCTLLWAHFSAANGFLCANSCLADPVTGQIVYNGAPPACPLGSCLACSEGFGAVFDKISGFTLQGTGVVERIARPCSAFTPVVHDPCAGALATPAPTGSPTITAMPTDVPTTPTNPPSAAFIVTQIFSILSLIIASFVGLCFIV